MHVGSWIELWNVEQHDELRWTGLKNRGLHRDRHLYEPPVIASWGAFDLHVTDLTHASLVQVWILCGLLTTFLSLRKFEFQFGTSWLRSNLFCCNLQHERIDRR